MHSVHGWVTSRHMHGQLWGMQGRWSMACNACRSLSLHLLCPGLGLTPALCLQGSPLGRPFGEFVQAAGVTMLGVVPSMVKAWKASGCMQARPAWASPADAHRPALCCAPASRHVQQQLALGAVCMR